MRYELRVNTDSGRDIVRLRLRDPDGSQVGQNALKLSEHGDAWWYGLFDTRRYVEMYKGTMLFDGLQEPASAGYLVERLGVFLGKEVLGSGIMDELLSTRRQRTLVVKLPTADEDPLAAAFARVPWEIARPGPGEGPLMESGLVIRLETQDDFEEGGGKGKKSRKDLQAQGKAERERAAQLRALKEEAEKIAMGEPLKILLVFADAPGTSPLAMRLEREKLLKLFQREILPKQNVRVDILCHGITPRVLEEQIRFANGYHVVHWSGHGMHNRLAITRDDGEKPEISGPELADIFLKAGGFIPQVVFLSACHSGAFIHVKDWESLREALAGKTSGAKNAETKVISRIVGEQTGYTGTALDLLKSHVSQVIAMRHEVADDYARELSIWFYRRLLADLSPRPVDRALAMARSDLLQHSDYEEYREKFWSVDHATPLLFGQETEIARPVNRPGPQLDKWDPMPQPLLPGSRDLDPPGDADFVGRGAELTRLKQEWLPDPVSDRVSGGSPDGKRPVALIHGMAGLGKTALAAEAIHLWHDRFDFVLCFQSRDQETTPDEFHRRFDEQLTNASTAYRERCERFPNECVYLPAEPRLTGDARFVGMRTNLVKALGREAVLIVIDNFETHLDPYPENNRYACNDPEWDNLLRVFEEELGRTRSRVLITSRRRPASVTSEGAAAIPLGPLALDEAILFVRNHRELSRLARAGEKGLETVQKLMDISRGHPLILNRLGSLAGDIDVLSDALSRLKTGGYKTLPDIFTETRTRPTGSPSRRTWRTWRWARWIFLSPV